MDEDKKDLMKDENYVLENITQEIEMIKDDTIPVPENTLKEDELIVETPKIEESVEVPVVTSVNTTPVSPSVDASVPTVTPFVDSAPVVETVNAEANTIVSENANKEEPKKKSKLPLLLILIILLAGCGAGVYFLTQGNNTSSKPEEKKEEKKEEVREKEEEYDVEKASYILDNFIFDHFHILDDDVKCAGLLSVFFKGKEVKPKDLSDEVVGSYIAGYASKAKSVDCTSESTDCIGGNDKFTMTLDEYKLFGSHLFGESRTYNIIPKLNYRSTECLYDEDTKTYNCTNNISYTGCTYYFEEHKLVKASKQGDIYRLYFKVVFEKDNKFYSDFEKTKEIEAVSATEAIEKIDESNYMITLKKVSSHYEFINSNIVK